MAESHKDERLDEVNESLVLLQKKNGLTFGTDAYLLSAFCRGRAHARAADFGCGTGAIALLLAACRRFATIFAVEVQEEFAELTRKNAEANALSAIVIPMHRDLRTLTAKDFGGELDVIVANPPYFKNECGFASPHACKQTARHEEHGGMMEFAAAAARCTKSGGLFYTVYRPDRLDTLFAALRAAKFAPKRMVFVQDAPSKAPSMVLTEAKLHAAEGLTLLPTLCLHDEGESTKLSARAQQIYDTGCF